MNLKDEIDKLISAERARLAQRDAKEKEFDELQKARFLPLRAVLEQLIKSVDPSYLRFQLTDYHASIEVGTHGNDNFEVNVQWRIEPKFTPREEPEDGEALFEAQPGFSVEEVTTCHRPEFRQLKHTYTFETERQVILHMLKEMAKWIAHYQHVDESARKRNSKDRP
jgi:hypothetical protein